jgi:hypothetical protein
MQPAQVATWRECLESVWSVVVSNNLRTDTGEAVDSHGEWGITVATEHWRMRVHGYLVREVGSLVHQAPPVIVHGRAVGVSHAEVTNEPFLAVGLLVLRVTGVDGAQAVAAVLAGLQLTPIDDDTAGLDARDCQSMTYCSVVDRSHRVLCPLDAVAALSAGIWDKMTDRLLITAPLHPAVLVPRDSFIDKGPFG